MLLYLGDWKVRAIEWWNKDIDTVLAKFQLQYKDAKSQRTYSMFLIIIYTVRILKRGIRTRTYCRRGIITRIALGFMTRIFVIITTVRTMSMRNRLTLQTKARTTQRWKAKIGRRLRCIIYINTLPFWRMMCATMCLNYEFLHAPASGRPKHSFGVNKSL